MVLNNQSDDTEVVQMIHIHLIQKFQWNPSHWNPDHAQNPPKLGIDMYNLCNLVQEEIVQGSHLTYE